MGKSIGNKFLSVLIGFVLLCLFLFNSVEAEISKKIGRF